MPNWTDAQLDAIKARRGTVLVSAAAGSGKTAVLVERVIERLTDPEHPTDADRLLVVTFTKAAAAEMRDRIEKRLLALMKEQPENTRLRRQQLLLQQAHICTVDSFCSDIVREFFYLLGISPDFSIITDKQQEELMTESLDEVLTEWYKDENFRTDLADVLGGDKNDARLSAAILKMYEYTRSHPFPDKWMRDIQKAMTDVTQSPVKTPWGEVVRQHIMEVYDFAIKLSHSAYRLAAEDPDLEKAYCTALGADIDKLSAKLQAMEDPETCRFSDLTVTFDKLGSFRGEDPRADRIKAMRDMVKKEIGKLQKLAGDAEDQKFTEEIAATTGTVVYLFLAVQSFEKTYSAKKREKNVLDFSDLEHMALQLFLTEQEDGTFRRTETAKLVSERFDEIMTDEYQDTNDVQDYLFESISQNSANRFMVGDVKQSIYSFRQAMPDIFIRYKDKFPRYDREKDAYPASIVLDCNFRSRKTVTESVNFVFAQLMSRTCGGIDYVGDEKLAAGAQYPEKSGCETRVEFLEDIDGVGAEVLEPQRIAKIICELMESGFTVTENGQERPIEYRDFCILLRSSNKYAPVYAENLRNAGIPTWAAVTGGFFAAAEVSLILAFLNVIDNPDQDIPLLSVLMSPIYGFTAEDMAQLRRECGGETLYVSLLRAENERCVRVRDELTRFRALASTMPADSFINTLCTETGYENIVRAMPGGESRLANIRLLEKYAAEYEAYGYSGVSGFVRFAERLKKNRSDMESANVVSENANVVRIMSIHKSKGLEFPVCIIAGCGRKFVNDTDDLRMHPQLGVGMRLTDPETGVRRTTFIREAIGLATAESASAEELRVFYVAMTRAKEKLILLSTVKNIDTNLQKLAAQITEEETVPPYTVSNASGISEWLMLCALRHPNGNDLRRRIEADDDIILRTHYTPWDIRVVYSEPQILSDLPKAEAPAPVDEALKSRIERDISFVYPYAAQTKLATKVAASALAAEQAETEATLSRPAFLSAKGLTPAERGTALHNFMQFADFSAASKDPKAELKRLIEQSYLTEAQANAVDLTRVEKFFTGPLGQRVLHADRVYKEQRFIVSIPAGLTDKTLSGEDAAQPMILQGAVDCMFEENGSLYILDFKTDRCYNKQELWERYGPQLTLYKEAMTRVMNKEVNDTVLYSFYMNAPVYAPGKE